MAPGIQDDSRDAAQGRACKAVGHPIAPPSSLPSWRADFSSRRWRFEYRLRFLLRRPARLLRAPAHLPREGAADRARTRSPLFFLLSAAAQLAFSFASASEEAPATPARARLDRMPYPHRAI